MSDETNNQEADRIFAMLATPVSEHKRDTIRRLLDDAHFEFEDIRLIYAGVLRPGDFVVPDDLEQQVINYRLTIHRLFPADRIFAILATPVSEDKRDRLRRLLDDADFEFEFIRLIYAGVLRPGDFVVPDDLEQQVINYRQARERGRDNDGASRPVEFIDNVEKSTGSQGDDSSLTMADMSTPERHTAAGTAVNEQDPENPETLLRGMHMNRNAQSNLRAFDLAARGAVDGSTGGSDGNASAAPDNEVGLPLSESNSGTVQSNPQNE